jgi:uncharacterized protein (DUF1800 family)
MKRWKHALTTAAALACTLALPCAAQGPAEARMDAGRGAAALSDAARPAADEVRPLSDAEHPPPAIVWNERNAEHLLNRAGFGARGSEVRAAVAEGLEACVDRLLSEHSDSEPFYVERYGPDYRDMADMSPDMRDATKRQVRRHEHAQMESYRTWWFERLMSGEDRLRERMTLFWHGYFTSSPAGVRRSYELLSEIALLRDNALESYADMLRAIVRNPAMLMYLDNHVNRKGNPNENFARELMELFTLGEGNYTEDDVKEAARALTGYASDGTGQFVFRKGQHDFGKKTILGRTGRFDGDDLVEILLAQDACPRWVAHRLITYLEGVEPDPARLQSYADFLRASDFKLRPFLRRLFLDPEFYRPEVVGTRVAGPVEFLVGISHRLGIEPPGQVMYASAAALGQKLLHPPNVAGWEEGMAWISTASLMQRGNYAGMMLGVVDPDEVVAQDDWSGSDPEGMGSEPGMDGSGMDGGASTDGNTMDGNTGMDAGMALDEPAQGPMPGELRAWRRAHGDWLTHLNLTARLKRLGASTDAEIVDALLSELLAVDASDASRRDMQAFLASERERLGAREGELLSARDGEQLLRCLAHLILSLPEAQLT